MTIKRKAQPKKVIDSDKNIAAYLKQCVIRKHPSAGGSASRTSDAVGRGDEGAGRSQRGAGNEHLPVGNSNAPFNFYSTAVSFTASTGAANVSAKQSKPRAPRKQ